MVTHALSRPWPSGRRGGAGAAHRRPGRPGPAAVVAAALAVGLLAGAAPPTGPRPASGTAPEQLYVAPWGRDSWPGTKARPFATLPRAQRAVRARTPHLASDLVVNLRGGTYRLRDTLRLSGTAGDSGRDGHRVTYQAYGYGTARQERVTLSGGRRVLGWRAPRRPGGAWRADVGDLTTRQLYVDGRRVPRAALGGGLPGRVRTTATGYVTDSPAPRGWRNPRDIEFAYTLPFWVDARCGVADITGARGHTVITMDQPCWRLARALYEDDGEPLTGPTDVLASPSFLRRPGSWYLDRSRPGHHVLHYLPRPGQDPRRTEVVAPVLETLVSGTGRPGAPLRDVTLRGLTFAHATWRAPDEPAGFVSAWALYKRPGVRTWLTVPGNVAFRGADGVRVEGNRFTHLGAQALELSRAPPAPPCGTTSSPTCPAAGSSWAARHPTPAASAAATGSPTTTSTTSARSTGVPRASAAPPPTAPSSPTTRSTTCRTAASWPGPTPTCRASPAAPASSATACSARTASWATAAASTCAASRAPRTPTGPSSRATR
ncbi:hypothetical protein [Streptomyces sp. G45]|uniref:hypothetical protein n=1 Tax=Streptomyces sp. G45 TaxID=3406627 RepID=UPI003C27D861